jgi:hypothetical protein
LSTNKLDRIKILKNIGLNTPFYYQISDKIDFGLLPYKHLSIRTGKTIASTNNNWQYMITYMIGNKWRIYFDRSAGMPHIPYIKKSEAWEIVGALIYCGFSVLACDGINPEGARYAGAAMVTADRQVIELSKSCMVRRVTVDGLIDVRVEVPPPPEQPDIAQISGELKILQKKMATPVVAELSYYNVPVGCKHENVIFWDFHPADSYKEWE